MKYIIEPLHSGRSHRGSRVRANFENKNLATIDIHAREATSEPCEIIEYRINGPGVGGCDADYARMLAGLYLEAAKECERLNALYVGSVFTN